RAGSALGSMPPRLLLPLALLLATVAACASPRPSGSLLSRRAPIAATHASRPERMTDEVQAAPGDAWSSELTSVIGLGGGVEWDLGTSQKITAAWVQADNNDEYAVLVSRDGRTWQTV